MFCGLDDTVQNFLWFRKFLLAVDLLYMCYVHLICMGLICTWAFYTYLMPIHGIVFFSGTVLKTDMKS